MAHRVLLIHGPNLNLLGKREVEHYGEVTLREINQFLEKKAAESNVELKHFQSNYEGKLVELIQEHAGWAEVLIINAGAFTHTSLAIRDAILATKIPVVEVHLSNIYKRETFRQKSYLADIAIGQITGFGYYSYLLAFDAALHYLSSKRDEPVKNRQVTPSVN
jgi:3-dehydroquinate dehydratase-2